MSDFVGGFHTTQPQSQPPHPPPQQVSAVPITFTFSQPNSKLFDCTISDSLGATPFVISSDQFYNAIIYQYEGTKTTIKGSDGAIVASVDWEHGSPRMVFGGGGLKCKEWFPYDKETRYVGFVL